MSEKDRWLGLPRRFKRKVLLVVGGLSAIATGAFAAILITAAIGGSMTVIDKPTLTWRTGPEAITTDGSGIKCTPTVSNGRLSVAVTDAMPGATCMIEADTNTPGTSGLVLQGIAMSGLDVTLSKGSSGTRLCGEALPHDRPSGYRMTLKVPENATAGTKPITGELTAVPQAQYDPLLCNN